MRKVALIFTLSILTLLSAFGADKRSRKEFDDGLVMILLDETRFEYDSKGNLLRKSGKGDYYETGLLYEYDASGNKIYSAIYTLDPEMQ